MAFLVFEGLDGSGKSTLMAHLQAELSRQQRPFLVTREPGGTPLGDEIRQLLLRTAGEAPVPRAELLLYQASRAQHVDRVIRPAMARGHWVLCDRYAASSTAFQCGGRGLEESEVEWLNRYATDRLAPDLYVLLDLTVEESARRRQGREAGGQAADRFEREEQDFHQRVRESYLRLAQAEASRWLVLDAGQTPEKLLQALLAELKRRQWLS